MTNEEFLKLAKRTVKDYTTEHLDKSDGEVDFCVYVVWSCKTLQTAKHFCQQRSVTVCIISVHTTVTKTKCTLMRTRSLKTG